jgi:hypothetical protein
MLSGFGERILRSNYQPLRESPDPLEVPVRLLCLVALSLALQSSAKRLGGKAFQPYFSRSRYSAKCENDMLKQLSGHEPNPFDWNHQ